MTGRKTIRIRVPQVEPGMVLGNDVFSGAGTVLLTKATLLTDYTIAQLRAWQIEYVDVKDAKNEKNPAREGGRNYAREDAAFANMYAHSLDSIAELFEEMHHSDKVPVQEFLPIAEGILDQVLGVQGVLRRLHQVKTGDEYTFSHSLNVGIYAVLIGSWLNYGAEDLRMLATAGLLHDAGKVKVPAAIIKKAGPLSADEYQEIQRHPFYGYQLVANTPGMPKKIALAVLQHHEREDGTGYPLKLSSPTILSIAKIIAVADVFDAVTSNRCYQAKRPPHVAASIIMEESFKSLDPVVAQSFLARIVPYLFNDDIRLNNGMTGRIIQLNRLSPTRPLVQTEQGFIDLNQMPELKIVDVV